MLNKIHTCLWFDGKAKEAAIFYCSLFNNSKIIADTPLVVNFELAGKKIMGLNGGPMFQINPSISFFVTCESNEEIETVWSKLLDGGMAMMALDKYPWSEKYGWVKDKFGMTWQLMLGELKTSELKIMPNLLFVGEVYCKAEKAIQFYTSIFKENAIKNVQIYQEGEAQPAGNLKFGHYALLGNDFTAMDGFGNHEFKFNEAVSFVVECETQEEIDYYWNKLTEGGSESMCGWLKDQFGISWQIVPTILGKLMTDETRRQRVMNAFLKMKKFDIQQLLDA